MYQRNQRYNNNNNNNNPQTNQSEVIGECQCTSFCNSCSHTSPPCCNQSNTIEINQAFIQAKAGRYFQGTSDVMPVIGDYNLIYKLNNPTNSCVTAYIDTIISSNHSPSPICVKTMFRGTTKGDLLTSYHFDNTNSYVGCNCKPTCCLTYGTRIELCESISCYNWVVDQYSSFQYLPHGTLILAPGCSFLVEICSINCSQTALANISIGWWEVNKSEPLIPNCL